MSHIGICTVCSAKARIIGVKVGDDTSRVCDECFGETDHRFFRIPSDNLHVLSQKFVKLGKRAKRLGLAEPTYRTIGEERIVKTHEITGLVVKVYMLHDIVVDAGCSTVQVAGWTFIATIQHTEEGNIIRAVGNQKIPPQYRKVTNLCEHCNTNRFRKDTYILQNGAEYKQVGRNCLADFFGHDALMFAERAQYLCDIDSLDGLEDDMGFGGGGGPRYDMLETYLSHVAQCVRMEGWMSRRRAREMVGCQATADLASSHLHPPMDFKPMYTHIEQESIALAESAIEWASEIEGEDIADYLHNIRIIARRGVVEPRDMGLGASIVSAYQRHLNTLRMKELQARRAEVATHVGMVGDRTRFKLHVEQVITCEGAFGTSMLHIMSDDAGNVFKWFSSSTTLECNSDVLLKGTIKKHDEYKGVKQNMLSRCEEVVLHNYYCSVDGQLHIIEAATELEVRKTLREKLSLKKLPKSTVIVQDKKEEEGAI